MLAVEATSQERTEMVAGSLSLYDGDDDLMMTDEREWAANGECEGEESIMVTSSTKRKKHRKEMRNLLKLSIL